MLLAIMVGVIFWLQNKKEVSVAMPAVTQPTKQIPADQPSRVMQTPVTQPPVTVNEKNSLEQAASCIDEKYKKIVNYNDLKEISKCFIKDDKNVYVAPYCGQDCTFELLSQADPNTFEVIGQSRYAKDKNFVYYVGLGKIDGANPKTFVAMTDSEYAKDNNHVYYVGNLIKSADAKTFEIVSIRTSYTKGLAKDKNATYSCDSGVGCGDKCKIIDSETNKSTTIKFTEGLDDSGICN